MIPLREFLSRIFMTSHSDFSLALLRIFGGCLNKSIPAYQSWLFAGLCDRQMSAVGDAFVKNISK